MQKTLRSAVKAGLEKTPAYYIEKYTGLVVGLTVGIYCINHFDKFSYATQKDFTDRLISICAMLFGFLVTVLTLIIQSNSGLIQEMKKYGSFYRLVNLNKRIILLSAVVVLISIFSMFVVADKEKETLFAKGVGSLIFFVFSWTVIDTFFFVRIFYALITYEEKNEEE